MPCSTVSHWEIRWKVVVFRKASSLPLLTLSEDSLRSSISALMEQIDPSLIPSMVQERTLERTALRSFTPSPKKRSRRPRSHPSSNLRSNSLGLQTAHLPSRLNLAFLKIDPAHPRAVQVEQEQRSLRTHPVVHGKNIIKIKYRTHQPKRTFSHCLLPTVP